MDLFAGDVLQQLILSSRFWNLNFPNTKSSFIAKISSILGPFVSHVTVQIFEIGSCHTMRR